MIDQTMLQPPTLPTNYTVKQGHIKTSTGKTIRTEEMIINMGPQHPSTHGVLRLEIVVDGEIIVDCIPHIGYLHRCFEKHCEHMTNYQMVIPYADRMDYCSAMTNEWAFALAAERLLKIEVPERVEYIRVIMAELLEPMALIQVLSHRSSIRLSTVKKFSTYSR
jgi:NADH-quinone oxidoreductase subunit D